MEVGLKFLSVAIGGALGSSVRYALNILLAEKFAPFPFATFLINITGSFLIGFLLILFTEKFHIDENLSLAIFVGFLGAYTTFSTFELEIFSLVKQREFVTAFVYLLASVSVGFIGVASGIWLAKKL